MTKTGELFSDGEVIAGNDFDSWNGVDLSVPTEKMGVFSGVVFGDFGIFLVKLFG